MNNYLIIDMDDVCINDGPHANGLNWVFYLKGKFPNFKITLFCIPGRSTFDWLDELSHISGVEIAMHGWNHDEDEEITEKILDEWPYAPIYKGPNWKVTDKELELLAKKGWTVAVKEKINYPITQWPLTDKRVMHGHVWVEGDWQGILNKINKDSEFLTIGEAV